MTNRLATSWATLTQAVRRRFPEEGQNPTPTNEEHDEDLEWPEEGEEDLIEESVPE